MPTEMPTSTPTEEPTHMPTPVPTQVLTKLPTSTPTQEPTEMPTPVPTQVPTKVPTSTPTQEPTEMPTQVPTYVPTQVPTPTPTEVPTEMTTPTPTQVTQVPTSTPTEEPTGSPTSASTHDSDAWMVPTKAPSQAPTSTTTQEPTSLPTLVPTDTPAKTPTQAPTEMPTLSPNPWGVPADSTDMPMPTPAPSAEPTVAPTPEPTEMPTPGPTVASTLEPTGIPTPEATAEPYTSSTAETTAEPYASGTAEDAGAGAGAGADAAAGADTTAGAPVQEAPPGPAPGPTEAAPAVSTTPAADPAAVPVAVVHTCADTFINVTMSIPELIIRARKSERGGFGTHSATILELLEEALAESIVKVATSANLTVRREDISITLGWVDEATNEVHMELQIHEEFVDEEVASQFEDKLESTLDQYPEESWGDRVDEMLDVLSDEPLGRAALTEINVTGAVGPAPAPASSGAHAADTQAPSAPNAPTKVYGDPHVVNVRGEKFSIFKLGRVTLLHLPRGSDERLALLQVEAEVAGTEKCSAMYVIGLKVQGRWLEQPGYPGSLHFRASSRGYRSPGSSFAFNGSHGVQVGNRTMGSLQELARILPASLAEVTERNSTNPRRPRRSSATRRERIAAVVFHFGHVELAVSLMSTTGRGATAPVNHLELAALGLGGAGCEVGGVLGVDSHAEVAALPARCHDRRHGRGRHQAGGGGHGGRHGGRHIGRHVGGHGDGGRGGLGGGRQGDRSGGATRKARGAPRASPSRKVPRASPARKVPKASAAQKVAKAGMMVETSWERVGALEARGAHVQLLGEELPAGTRACYDYMECRGEEVFEASDFVDFAENSEVVAHRA